MQMGGCLLCNGKISHTLLPFQWFAVVAWTFITNGKNQCHDLSTLQYKCKNSIHIPFKEVIILSDNYWLPLQSTHLLHKCLTPM